MLMLMLNNIHFHLCDVSSVYATATWLAGWMSHTGIVSKWLNLS